MDIVSVQKHVIGRVRVYIFGLVAQLVEHLVEAQGVGGSTPSQTIVWNYSITTVFSTESNGKRKNKIQNFKKDFEDDYYYFGCRV